MEKEEIAPLRLIPSLIIFLITAAIIYFTHYYFVPAFQRFTHQPYLTGYLIGWGSNMLLIFSASIVAYKLEKRSLKWIEFSNRFSLRGLSKRDWLWTILLITFVLLFYFGLSFTSTWLAKQPIFAPHPQFPEDMVSGNLEQGYLFGMELKGKWWIVIVYFIFWLINIFGEEFWYRGWMLPRQEQAFGKYAWLINGLMFTFQHWLQPWNFLLILPGALFQAYIVQNRQNTWIGIIQHGLMNLSLLVYIVIAVIR